MKKEIKFIQIATSSTKDAETLFGLDQYGRIWYRFVGRSQWMILEGPTEDDIRREEEKSEEKK